MYHLDEDGSLYGKTAVDGKYQRTFTQQESGIVNFAVRSGMAADYKRSRDAARKKDKRKSELVKAVFASDKIYDNLPYPIRSGYYFNPTGTYQFTVETVTYKPTPDDTNEHKTLVQNITNSFRYESNMVYNNSRDQAVDLQNRPATKKGSVYVAKTAVLTPQNPVGLNGVSWISVGNRNTDPNRYTKEVKEITHATNVDGSGTHEYFKNVLEGYEESGTLSSFNNFKYREYIKPGQTMYKITEKTTVTITVNPGDTKAYTHIQMADAKYRVRAYFEDINLQNINAALPPLKGIVLDNIEITVVGSLYDDMIY